jgi:hypothetical protein
MNQYWTPVITYSIVNTGSISIVISISIHISKGKFIWVYSIQNKLPSASRGWLVIAAEMLISVIGSKLYHTRPPMWKSMKCIKIGAITVRRREWKRGLLIKNGRR